jgi:hypothetical protein
MMLSSCGRGQKSSPAETAQESSLRKGVILVDYRDQNRVDVYIDGDLFTSYIYPEDLEKPVLYPVRTAEGTIVTRGYPLKPKAGERVDHPHQVGVWFTYGDVNGFDFWNNSSAIPEDEKMNYGRVLHRGVKRAESREGLGVLEIAADWQVPADEGEWHTLLQENTVFEFSGDEKTRTIDRITRLTAQDIEVELGDNKEGLFAIRVARELEHPTNKSYPVSDAQGNAVMVEKPDNKGVNGHYLNSEGDEGTDAWGRPARWVRLSSSIGDEKICLVLFDHPGNIGFPSYWHTRDYGLISINNLSARDYDESAEPRLLSLTPGESIVFRHRLYIISGSVPSPEQIETIFGNFASR